MTTSGTQVGEMVATVFRTTYLEFVMQQSKMLSSKTVSVGLVVSVLFVNACEGIDGLRFDQRNGGVSVDDASEIPSTNSETSVGSSAPDASSESNSAKPSVDDNDSESKNDDSIDTKPGEHVDCIHHKAWWKTHSRFAKGKNNHRPWPKDEDTELCGQIWYEIMWTPSKDGDPWYKLAYQWIAASLNVANGAMPTAEVESAIVEADLMLASCAIEKSSWKDIHDLEKLLHAFNQGQTDATCEDSTSGEDNTTGEDNTSGVDSTSGDITDTGEDSTTVNATGTGDIPPAP